MLLALLVAAGPLPSERSHAATLDADATFEPAPCFVPLPEGVAEGEDVTCGYVPVPLRYGEPAGPRIRIAVAVVAAREEVPGHVPLMELIGGPGGHLLELLPLYLAQLGEGNPFFPLAATRDVILLDQRGVGFSQPALDCPEASAAQVPPDASPLEQIEIAKAVFAACRDRLVDVEGIDLSAFDTLANVQDLDRVRRALGYQQVDVQGGSYGALLGLQTARGTPGWIRSLVLESAIPAEQNYIEDVPASYQQALDTLFAACAADRECSRAFPDLEASLNATIERLVAEPDRVEIIDSETGETIALTITAPFVAQVVFFAFYTAPLIPLLPAFIAGAEQGDYSLLPLLLPPDLSAVISLGMFLSVVCAEEVAYADRAAVEAAVETASPPVQQLLRFTAIGLPLFEVCADWNVERASPLTFRPVRTTIPTLIVNGAFDHVTPPQYGEQVARRLPNSVLVEVAAAGHGPLSSAGACGVRIREAFLERPTVAPDSRCAKEPIEFVIEPGPQLQRQLQGRPPASPALVALD